MAASVAGIVLAAGAGIRYGMPKALVIGDDGVPWVTRACAAFEGAGCSPVIVVLGASAADVAPLVPPFARVVVAADWALGMSESLRAGLAAAASTDAVAIAVTLVDLPTLPVAAVARLVASAGIDTLRQASYGGRPGHPVVLGRSHWQSLADSISGDHGARAYVAAHGGELIECGDLDDGLDVDR